MDEPVDLPEGTEVALSVVEDGDDLDDEDRARLHVALIEAQAQAERGEVTPARQVLAEIRTRRGG